MIRRTHLAVLGGLCALATACHTPGGVVQQTITIEFTTYDSSAAKPSVVQACGTLPGETVQKARNGDPNLILDVSHASASQQAAIITCLGNLQAARPDLQIRAVIPYNGEDN